MSKKQREASMASVLICQRNVGVTESKKFNDKHLATHAVNVGLLCGHGCKYCPAPALMRTHSFFKENNTTSFVALENGDAVIDLWTHIRVKKQIGKLTSDHVVMMSTVTDCWAPETHEHGMGRKILTAILENSECQVRILTKNAAVSNDYDLISKYCDRVMVGLSITAPTYNEHIVKAIEPKASSISERLDALYTARDMGLRTYGMLCPVLPGIGTDPKDYDSMLQSVLAANPEVIWTEPLNSRGPNIINCVKALRKHGFNSVANDFEHIRNSTFHMLYVEDFINTATNAAINHDCLEKFKILVHSDGDGLNVNDSAVIWLKR